MTDLGALHQLADLRALRDAAELDRARVALAEVQSKHRDTCAAAIPENLPPAAWAAVERGRRNALAALARQEADLLAVIHKLSGAAARSFAQRDTLEVLAARAKKEVRHARRKRALADLLLDDIRNQNASHIRPNNILR